MEMIKPAYGQPINRKVYMLMYSAQLRTVVMEQPLGSGIQKLQTVVGVMEVISAIPAPVGGFVMLWEMSETVEGKLMNKL